MDLWLRLLILSAIFLILVKQTSADTYNVKVGTEHHVNVVDSRFLSFTVDPKYLFAGSEKYYSQESTCMAAALSPAYIRIAGPSTANLRFSNATISFIHLDHHQDTRGRGLQPSALSVSHNQWQRFVRWARNSDFKLVFALNAHEKTSAGLWDPNGAISILTVADQANVSDIYWQLGYECQNQTIEEYLNDLQTLRVITETFPREHWRVVAGDVSPCLSGRSKSDFKDYVTLSEDLLDAVLLNGNSSAYELNRMSETDRLKLLKLLSVSETPLWLTESANYHAITQDKQGAQELKFNELRRAADWMSSLGYSARNGFAVHFRELVEDELYEPSLSFYMALLFKNLVGERVLEVTMEASQAVLFAHCTSLRRKPIPGAVTLFGANMDDEPARMAVKLSKREEGGDIMQFILAHDVNGNIIVNGRAMYHEGDIRPVVKRVRPYKTLLLNLPPRSFGFWVLANTNIEACHEIDNKSHEHDFVEAITVTEEDTDDSNKIMTKRSMLSRNDDGKLIIGKHASEETLNDSFRKHGDKVKSIKDRVKNINSDLKKVRKLFKRESKEMNGISNSRVKRQIYGQENGSELRRKLRRQNFKSRLERNRASIEEEKPLDFIRKLIHQIPKLNGTRHLRHEKSRKLLTLSRNKLSKRSSRHFHGRKTDLNAVEDNVSAHESNTLERKRRSILNEIKDEKESELHAKRLRKKIEEADSTENEIDSAEQAKLWKILKRIHKQIEDLPENDSSNRENKNGEDQIVVKTKLLDDGATIKLQKLDHGLIKSTVGNVMSVLKDLNKNLNKFWGALALLE